MHPIQESRSKRFQKSIHLHGLHANPSAYQANSVRTIRPFVKTILPSCARLVVARADAELALEGAGEIREGVEADRVSNFLGQCAGLGTMMHGSLGRLRGKSPRAQALSGGQQQRVALARDWALKPQVLLLDKPTSSLDPAAKREVEGLLAEFADAGMTLIFSSHNLGQVKRLASRVVYLEHGRLVADLPVADFFGGPLPAAAASFLKGNWDERV